MKLIQLKKYLLLIDEEAEINKGDIAIHDFGMGYDLEIPCDKDNLKSNTRKLVIAYYPLTKEAEELDLPLLPDPFEDSFDITSWAKDEHKYNHRSIHELSFILGCEVGYKAAQSKQFSLEDMKKAYDIGASDGYRRCEGNNYYPDTDIPNDDNADRNFEEDRKEFIQSLSTQQLPKEFIPEYEADISNSPYTSNKYNKALKALKESSKIGCKLKTTTNSEGKEILVGTYKY